MKVAEDTEPSVGTVKTAVPFALPALLPAGKMATFVTLTYGTLLPSQAVMVAPETVMFPVE